MSQMETKKQDPLSAQALTDRIVKAQAVLKETNNPKVVSQHLRETTYPLLADVVSSFNDFEDLLRSLVDGNGDDFLTVDTAEFFRGYFEEVVLAFIGNWSAEAHRLSDAGDDRLFRDLEGLLRGAKAGLSIVQDIAQPAVDEENTDA